MSAMMVNCIRKGIRYENADLTNIGILSKFFNGKTVFTLREWQYDQV